MCRCNRWIRYKKISTPEAITGQTGSVASTIASDTTTQSALATLLNNDTQLNSIKVNVSDIQNSLSSTATNKPLSAAQGKALNDKKFDKKNLSTSTETTVNQFFAPVAGRTLKFTINGNLGVLIFICNSSQFRLVDVNTLYDTNHVIQLAGTASASDFAVSVDYSTQRVTITVNQACTITVIGLINAIVS